MPRPSKSTTLRLALMLTILLAGMVAIVRWDIAQRRTAFRTDAQIAHRILSQRATQQEAVLSMLGLLHTGTNPAWPTLSDLQGPYPQIVNAIRRAPEKAWPEAALSAAEAKAATGVANHIAASALASDGSYWLVFARPPENYALLIDPLKMVPWAEWPFDRNGPVRTTLSDQNRRVQLAAGEPEESKPAGLTSGFEFAGNLASASQPFELRFQRATGPSQWPWRWLAAWAALVGVLSVADSSRRRLQRERKRAQELLRIGHVARLNSLGELAAGMAHELNQPLSAVLASTQAAQRLLADEPPSLDTARQALGVAASQARRAADVVARLRRTVESPDAHRAAVPVDIAICLAGVLELLEPDLRRLAVRVETTGKVPSVRADPVALEQIIHNLLLNALTALAQSQGRPRQLTLHLSGSQQHGLLSVRDNGPGIAAEAMGRIFEPFYTSRPDGLGLGLSLCESLAQNMDGTLEARNAQAGGAEFILKLPLES